MRVLLALFLFAASAASAGAAPDVRLVDAARQQDAQAVRALLREKADANAAGADGATALHWAVRWEDQEIAELLIRAGANVSAADRLGVTPLFVACDNGDARMVERLLAAGARPHAAFAGGETELMAAARAGSAPAVKALLAAGATVDAQEPRRGQTALMWAVAGRHPAVVQALLEGRANVHVRSRVIQVTVNVSDPFNTRGRTSDAETEFVRAPDPHVTGIPQGGVTALMFAARTGDVESARLLLEAGANVDDAGADGASALVVAAHSNHLPLAQLLLERGADPDASGAGYSALHAALLRGNATLLEALLAHRANPNALVTKPTPSTRFSCNFTLPDNLIGSTPFLLAARFAAPDMMRALVAAGADPRTPMPDGTTALMLAAGGFGIGSGDRRQRPACADGPHDNPETAVQTAAVILALGQDVNAVNETGDTALHAAAAKGLTPIVDLLANSGARLDQRNERGRTALGVASSRAGAGGLSAAALLRNRGAK